MMGNGQHDRLKRNRNASEHALKTELVSEHMKAYSRLPGKRQRISKKQSLTRVQFQKYHKLHLGSSCGFPMPSSIPYASVPPNVEKNADHQMTMSNLEHDFNSKKWESCSASQDTEFANEPALHNEAFGGVWGRAWLARKRTSQSTKSFEFRRIRLANENVTKSEGLAHHGLREIALYAQLKSSPCVDLLEVHFHGGFLQLTYSFYQHDLLTFMHAHPLQASSIQSLSKQLMVAIDYLHRRSILHGNIKGQSVLICSRGNLVLAGMCTAALANPMMTGPSNFRSTWPTRAPELLLGPWVYGPAQDIWSCGMLMAQMCKYKGFGPFGLECSNQGASMEINSVVPIFRRLGTPCKRHPLTALPRWNRYLSEEFPHWERKGWEEKMDLLGNAGVRLLDCLTDLDVSCRLSAETAIAHEYFQRPAPRLDDVEVFIDGETFIQAYCPTGCQEWCRHIEESDCEDIDMLANSVPHEEQQDNLERESFETVEVTVLAEKKLNSGNCEALAESSVDEQVLDGIEFGCEWNSLRHRSFQFYLERDLAKERSRDMHILTCIKGVSAGLSRTVPEICHIVCRFLFRVPSRNARQSYFPLGIDINTTMRAILNDWLGEVAWKYNFEEPVLFFAVELIDAYLLTDRDLKRKYLQLLGVAALLVASKILAANEVDAADMIYVCDNAYTMQELLEFETKLVPILERTSIGWGCFHFLAHYCSELHLDKKHFHMAYMCLERSLLTHQLSQYTPSLLAAGACVVAGKLLKKFMLGQRQEGDWAKLCELSCRSTSKIRKVAYEITVSFDEWVNSSGRPFSLTSARKKFSTPTFSNVASLLPSYAAL